jgi:thiamine-phosphate pyrophosphorylase
LRKLVYLISPLKINKNFYKKLDRVLSFGNSAYFQLRLKDKNKSNILRIARKILKITKKHKVKLIINDDYKLSLKVKADGCHLGQLDGSIKVARQKLKKKILGVTCHNSKLFAKNAIREKADYLAFGSFYKSKLKPKSVKAKLSILKWSLKNFKKPIVAIGGINDSNYKMLIRTGAKYIAISSFIWDNPKLKPEMAIKKFK